MHQLRVLMLRSAIVALGIFCVGQVFAQTGINPNMAPRKKQPSFGGESLFNSMPATDTGKTSLIDSEGETVNRTVPIVRRSVAWQKAADFCISRTSEFEAAMQMKLDAPEQYKILFKAKAPSALAVEFALLADSLKDTTKFNKWIVDNKVGEADSATKAVQIATIRVSASALRAVVQRYRDGVQRPSGAVYAEGAISDILKSSGSKGTQQKALSGSLGAQFKFSNWSFSLSLALASSVDTLRGHAAYAQALLTPSYGDGALKSALIDAQRSYNNSRCGIHGYVSWSQTLWGSDSAEIRTQLKGDSVLRTNVAKTLAQDSSKIFGNATATSIGVGILGFYNLAGGADSTAVSASLEAGFAARILLGDVAHNPDYLNTHILTETSLFGGLELGAQVVYSKIVMHIEFYALTGKGNAVDGLTGAQVAGRVSIQAPIAEF